MRPKMGKIDPCAAHKTLSQREPRMEIDRLDLTYIMYLPINAVVNSWCITILIILGLFSNALLTQKDWDLVVCCAFSCICCCSFVLAFEEKSTLPEEEDDSHRGNHNEKNILHSSAGCCIRPSLSSPGRLFSALCYDLPSKHLFLVQLLIESKLCTLFFLFSRKRWKLVVPAVKRPWKNLTLATVQRVVLNVIYQMDSHVTQIWMFAKQDPIAFWTQELLT